MHHFVRLRLGLDFHNFLHRTQFKSRGYARGFRDAHHHAGELGDGKAARVHFHRVRAYGQERGCEKPGCLGLRLAHDLTPGFAGDAHFGVRDYGSQMRPAPRH